jgi:hypothetical protein
VSVQRSQPSIKHGQTATYVVQVTTKNGSASDVSVALTAQPSSQKPTFSSGCASGNGTAICGVNSVTTAQPASLKAQIAVASTAASVTSVKLTATASVVTTATWTPPAAAMTTAVTAAAPAKSAKAKAKANAKAKAKAKTSQATPNLAVLPLGPIPALNGQASLLIGAGNAASLFPAISPSPGASPGPTATATATATPQPAKPKATPVSEASPVSLGTPLFTAQVAGLIALGLAIMLVVTRLSLRKRSGKPRS